MKAELAVAALGLFLLAGCGSPPPPIPAPVPQNNNQIGFVGGGNCGSAGGVQPLRPDNRPYQASLRLQNQIGNSISLYLSFADQVSFDQKTRALAAGGSITLSSQTLQTPMPIQAICLSNAMPGFNTQSYGSANMVTSAIAITLYGTAQLPTVNPYQSYGGNYPGLTQPQTQLIPVPVTVDIGTECPAGIVNGGLSGCVHVVLGQQQAYNPYNPYQQMPQQMPKEFRFSADPTNGVGGFGF